MHVSWGVGTVVEVGPGALKHKKPLPREWNELWSNSFTVQCNRQVAELGASLEEKDDLGLTPALLVASILGT